MSDLALEPTRTKFGDVLTILLDGQPAWKLRCPGCGEWAYLDEDQLQGRVSVDHADTGCSYHETHDFGAEIDKAGSRDHYRGWSAQSTSSEQDPENG